MIIGYDKNPNASIEWKLQTLMESVQMALNEITTKLSGLNASETDRAVSALDFYPVGSYYETSDTSFDPNTAWGGTWSLETEGLVHIGAGATYTAGDTGGSKDSVVVSHKHYPGNGDTFGFVTYEGGAGTGRQKVAVSSDASARYAYVGTSGASSAETSGINYSNDTTSTGEVGTDKNMQPYVVVNRWHRTA